MSARRRSPGSFRWSPRAGAQSGAESSARGRTQSGQCLQLPLSLQQWGSLVGPSRSSSSTSSSCSRYSIASPLPCRCSREGGRAGGVRLRWRRGGRRGGRSPGGHGVLGSPEAPLAIRRWVCRAGHACDPTFPAPRSSSLGLGVLAAVRVLRAVPGGLRGSWSDLGGGRSGAGAGPGSGER